MYTGCSWSTRHAKHCIVHIHNQQHCMWINAANNWQTLPQGVYTHSTKYWAKAEPLSLMCYYYICSIESLTPHVLLFHMNLSYPINLSLPHDWKYFWSLVAFCVFFLRTQMITYRGVITSTCLWFKTLSEIFSQEHGKQKLVCRAIWQAKFFSIVSQTEL